MNEMVERAARAFCAHDDPDAPPCPCNGNCTGWTGIVEPLRAAIASLRAPSEAMLRADGAGAGDWMIAGMKANARRKLWQTMIDAALLDPATPEDAQGSAAIERG